jgi:hypothetical protein
VTRPEALVGLAETDVILVDLSKKGVIEALPDIVASGARVVAFGSHVDKTLLARAEAAGCALVLPRSAFFGNIADLIT